ncbi:carbamoyltransferase HypF [Mesorhizobium sp. PL10]
MTAGSGADGFLIRVRGLVQGVGFRPSVWQVATGLGLAGHVCNTSAGVTIALACSQSDCDAFILALNSNLPALARIDALHREPFLFAPPPGDFTILASEEAAVSAAVVADAKICQACLADIRDPLNRRFGYAFANCTHCGPRFTIVRRIPYDRASTAMAAFSMCEACRAEYDNPGDRRFHAQPVACAGCGPRLWLETAPDVDGGEGDPLAVAAMLILSGHIVALKGLGGFHLACDAANEDAVVRLRRAKQRPAKPLALMARSIEDIRSVATCSDPEAALLDSSAGPIVLLEALADAALAPSVAPGQSSIGIMLPTTPLHALLMDAVRVPLVMTSANESGIPQCVTNTESRRLLGGGDDELRIADAVLLHDRDIVSRVDDSVIRLDRTGVSILRRARGFAPQPLRLRGFPDNGVSVFAAGADLKSAFGLAGNGEVLLSQHLGDLDEPETRAAYAHAVQLYADMFQRRPGIVAVDAHPQSVSAALGRALALETGARVVAVQHHHAHMASCMAENGWTAGPVLGVVLDGTGFGTDGTIWGGEFLAGTFSDVRRLAHFLPVPLIGGDRAAMEPWRNAFSHLHAAFGDDLWQSRWSSLDVIRRLAQRPVATTRSVMVARSLSPLSSSAGRLFDAAAHVIGMAPERMGYEGQTGMELEALAAPAMAGARAYGVTVCGAVLHWDGLWRGLLDDLLDGADAASLAACFHATLIATITERAIALCSSERLEAVALTGGVFQNRLLLEGVHDRLSAAGLSMLVHNVIPANDGGIALGQAAVATALTLRPMGS